MKELKKIILLLIIILISTGCTAKYNLTINEDLSLDEDATINEYKEESYNDYGDMPEDKYIAMVNKKTQETINKYQQLYPNHQITTINNTKELGATTTTHYKNLQELKQSESITKTFNKASINENSKRVSITLEDINDNIYNLIDNYEITIKLPHPATSSNATSSDRKTNTYKWEFQDAQKPVIKLSFNKGKIDSNNGSIINNNNNKFIILIIAILVPIIIIPIIVLILYQKSQGVNKI